MEKVLAVVVGIVDGCGELLREQVSHQRPVLQRRVLSYLHEAPFYAEEQVREAKTRISPHF